MVDVNAQEWVNVLVGAEITGYNLDHIRRIARDNWKLPEDQRVIRVRLHSRAYEMWLPDLLKYTQASGRGSLAKRRQSQNLVPSDNSFKFIPTPDFPNQEIWVDTGEAAEITGYHRVYLQQLSRKIWQQPEEQRLIKLRHRAKKYEFWLPDLINYIVHYGYNPRTFVDSNE
ncbi:MAG TPA: hypothetical protein VHL11_22235 [Phototrophicaceae bacterium]|jgi:hypothetical protein|nr:hypothetical protein [Phototrophicaceae bacterium]